MPISAKHFQKALPSRCAGATSTRLRHEALAEATRRSITIPSILGFHANTADYFRLCALIRWRDVMTPSRVMAGSLARAMEPISPPWAMMSGRRHGRHFARGLISRITIGALSSHRAEVIAHSSSKMPPPAMPAFILAIISSRPMICKALKPWAC